MASSRLLVHELKCAGHCVPYALDLARDAHAPGREVRLLLNGLAREQFDGLRGCNELPDGLEVEFTDPMQLPGPLTEIQKFELDHMQSSVKSFRPDRMLVPTADALIRGTGACRALRRALSARGSDCPWELVIHLVPASSPRWSPRPQPRGPTGQTSCTAGCTASRARSPAARSF